MKLKQPLKLIENGNNATTTIVFTEAEDKIPINDLADYLRYLKALYSYLEKRPEILNSFEGKSLEYLNENRGKIEKIVRSHFEMMDKSYFNISPSYQRDLKGKDLYIDEIKKQSPLEIVFDSAGILIFASVFISGGKIDLLRMRFELNALGEGLQKLKDLFHERKKKKK